MLLVCLFIVESQHIMRDGKESEYELFSNIRRMNMIIMSHRNQQHSYLLMLHCRGGRQGVWQSMTAVPHQIIGIRILPSSALVSPAASRRRADTIFMLQVFSICNALMQCLLFACFALAPFLWTFCEGLPHSQGRFKMEIQKCQKIMPMATD